MGRNIEREQKNMTEAVATVVVAATASAPVPALPRQVTDRNKHTLLIKLTTSHVVQHMHHITVDCNIEKIIESTLSGQCT
jgi:phosphoribosyl-AMP cyclohydrolase